MMTAMITASLKLSFVHGLYRDDANEFVLSRVDKTLHVMRLILVACRSLVSASTMRLTMFGIGPYGRCNGPPDGISATSVSTHRAST